MLLYYVELVSHSKKQFGHQKRSKVASSLKKKHKMALYLAKCDPRVLSPQEYRSRFCCFLETTTCCLDSLIELVKQKPPANQHCSFEISCSDLVDFDASLAFRVTNFPRLLLPLFDDALFLSQSKLVQILSGDGTSHGEISAKKFAHVRIVELPPPLCKRGIGDFRSDDANTLVELCGTVSRTGSVRMLNKSRTYQCGNPKCGFRFPVFVDYEQGNAIPAPRQCPAIKGQADPNKPADICGCTTLHEVEGLQVCVDYQEIRIQDKVEHLALGGVPRCLTIMVEADLVDKVNPGDDIVCTGVLTRRWRYLTPGARCAVEIVLQANSIRIRNSFTLSSHLPRAQTDFNAFWKSFESGDMNKKSLRGRDVIVRSLAPALFGMYAVKLSLLLVLIGGCSHDGPNHNPADLLSPRRRHNAHMLFIGDPGTGLIIMTLQFIVLLHLMRCVMDDDVRQITAAELCDIFDAAIATDHRSRHHRRWTDVRCSS